MTTTQSSSNALQAKSCCYSGCLGAPKTVKVYQETFGLFTYLNPYFKIIFVNSSLLVCFIKICNIVTELMGLKIHFCFRISYLEIMNIMQNYIPMHLQIHQVFSGQHKIQLKKVLPFLKTVLCIGTAKLRATVTSVLLYWLRFQSTLVFLYLYFPIYNLLVFLMHCRKSAT